MKPSVIQKTICYRRWKSLDIDQFCQSIDNIDIETIDSVSDLALLYKTSLHNLLEKHISLNAHKQNGLMLSY